MNLKDIRKSLKYGESNNKKSDLKEIRMKLSKENDKDKVIEFTEWLISHLQEALNEIDDIYTANESDSGWADSVQDQLTKKVNEYNEYFVEGEL